MSHKKPHSEEAREKISRSKTGVPNWKIRRQSKEVDGVMTYRCNCCNDFLEKEKFYTNNTPMGFEPICKSCVLAKKKQRNIEKKLLNNRDEIQRTKDKLRGV